jgi:hypothetical protein
MRAEFASPDDEARTPVAVASWTGATVDVDAADDQVRERVAHAFRPTPVVTDDAASRQLGTSGEVVLQPGTLEWFRAAALVRVPAETGLAARLIPEAQGGFDPAAQYRTFGEQMARLERAADRS